MWSIKLGNFPKGVQDDKDGSAIGILVVGAHSFSFVLAMEVGTRVC